MLTKDDLKQISQLLNKKFAAFDVKVDEKFAAFDVKVDEKLDPIKQQIFSIKQDIKGLEEKLDRVINANNENLVAVNIEVEKLKKKVYFLENKIKQLEKNN